MGHLESLRHRFQDRVAFFVVYIREAHPINGWQVEANERDAVLYEQPTTLDERTAVAGACALHHELTIPTLIDDMENSTDRKYYALPDRLYLVGADGRIAFRGAPGPFGFIVSELERAIEQLVGEAPEA